jgi:hypothetical protein
MEILFPGPAIPSAEVDEVHAVDTCTHQLITTITIIPIELRAFIVLAGAYMFMGVMSS